MSCIAKKDIVLTMRLFIVLYLVLFSGCSAKRGNEKPEKWRELVKQLIDVERIARLDVPASKLISSYDPTGGNDDNNRYLRKGPKGWWVIADLKGPGYVSRFWLTGVEADHGLRLYFDNERWPRIDTTVGQFFEGGKFPPPLSNFEQNCRYTYVPIPYAERLIIMTQEAGMKPDQL